MKVYSIEAGSIDSDGADTTIGIHYEYDTAMGYAKVMANKIVRGAAEYGERDYKVHYEYEGPEGEPHNYGKVSVYAGDSPDWADYWYIIREWIVNP